MVKSHLLVYTGGTEAAFYQMMRATLPESGSCGKPIIHDDGSVEYPYGEPADIEGYERVDTLFKPMWPSCRWRALHVSHPDTIQIRATCLCPLGNSHLQDVHVPACMGCTLRIPIDQQKKALARLPSSELSVTFSPEQSASLSSS